MMLSRHLIVFLAISFSLASCAHDPFAEPLDQEKDKMIVYSDGTMEFRGRTYSTDNVVIYPDGFGGERAAVKLYVPLHPDFSGIRSLLKEGSLRNKRIFKVT